VGPPVYRRSTQRRASGAAGRIWRGRHPSPRPVRSRQATAAPTVARQHHRVAHGHVPRPRLARSPHTGLSPIWRSWAR